MAAQWRQLSKPGDKQDVWVDSSSLSRSGDMVSLWARISPPVLAQPGDVDANGLPVQRTIAVDPPSYLIQISCSGRLLRISTQGASAMAVNPFAPENMSPYTFQPLRNAASYQLYSNACPQPGGGGPVYTQPDQTRIMPSTPARTMAAHRDPWADKLSR